MRVGAILLATVGCVLFVETGWASPVRVILSLAFLLFVPGLALTELIGIRDVALRIVIATSASLALETLLAIGLVYAGAFSTRLAIAILGAFTFAIVALALLRVHRSQSGRNDRF